MQTLTSEGRRVVAELAERHGFSEDAVAHILDAVLAGNGGMAMFDHREFGGPGQWMKGGMLMLSDMFNHALKARVDALCNDIASMLANEPDLLRSGSFQSQTQGAGSQLQAAGGGAGQSSLFVPDTSASWWPAELGQPAATGSQNNVRYAYFPQAQRLAVEVGGRVRVYDTGDHRITGFSQQQAGSGSITFASQRGIVDLNRLPLVSEERPGSAHSAGGAGPRPAGPAEGHGAGRPPEDVFVAIERLGKLRDDGLLTEEEFAQKKAELLSRI